MPDVQHPSHIWCVVTAGDDDLVRRVLRSAEIAVNGAARQVTSALILEACAQVAELIRLARSKTPVTPEDQRAAEQFIADLWAVVDRHESDNARAIFGQPLDTSSCPPIWPSA